MARNISKQILQHQRPVTQTEIDAFVMIHKQTEHIVMVPAVINGEDRFGLAKVVPSEEGTSVQIIAVMVTPSDKMCLLSGEEVAVAKESQSQLEEKINNYLN